uniref:Peroxidase n=1 Tax=Cenchrus ciliaris TaxID=35872 RepID=Q43416_CENCI|nr:peroxidase [Cenchrus ciliaris]
MAAPTLMQCLLAISLLSFTAHAQLSTTFYASSCPNLQTVVRAAMTQAVSSEPRMGASILRLFFHDCFVQGCDASILSRSGGEKSAGPNANSVRGYEVIDTIKKNVEAACPGVVSCATIVPLAARPGPNLLGGPTWNVPLGRRDSTTAMLSLANQNLPPPTSLGTLISLFGGRLSARDMIALSGAHHAQARCTTFRGRIYGDTNIDASFAALQQQTCPRSGGDGNLAPIDAQTPARFDNAYYTNLVSRRGLFHSDQELFNGGSQDALVRQYSSSPSQFNSDFVAAMIKMGNIGANAGQVRRNCRVVNS